MLRQAVTQGMSIDRALQHTAACRMLRQAVTQGMTIDRSLAATAAHLSQGRLLSPPSNLVVSVAYLQRLVPVDLDRMQEQLPGADPRGGGV